jgi:hypothetical protein
VLSDRALQKIRDGGKGHEYAEGLLTRWGARRRRPGEDPAAWLREALLTAGVQRLRHSGNHKYAFTLGKERKLVAIQGLSRPYPKQPDRGIT